ncbi:unnamed protein product [Ectocarpus sp. 12 AP-2014]
MERNSEDRYNNCVGPRNLIPFPAFWKILCLVGAIFLAGPGNDIAERLSAYVGCCDHVLGAWCSGPWSCWT